MTTSARLNTALADRYRIDRQIGAGGMATVWLATDIKHNRHVALKLLNPELGAVLGTERFLSEIQVTANLHHPNLLPLFDSGEADGLLFYVMPYVEGESLRARLQREKQLPVDEAVRIAVAIAGALDYAHSHGVIHRDLKPENILMQSGQPVIADFGIALAVSNAGGARITQTGLSLGTPQYMSPEQATGDRVIDGRTDIYSLGCMLYEMLVGDPPHTASTAQAIIAKVLTDRPRSVRLSRPAVPEHVADAVERALEKLPADRYSTAREFAEALGGHGQSTSPSRTATQRAAHGRSKTALVWGLAAAAAILLATTIVAWSRLRSVRPPQIYRFTIGPTAEVTPEWQNTWSVVPSPDGNTIVFLGRAKDGKVQLFSRRVDEIEPRPIAGTPEPSQPVFSPDGRWLAFLSHERLQKVLLEGGSPIAIATAGSNNGMDWSTRDVIVLGAERGRHGLSRVPASGGELVQFTKIDTTKREVDHVWPVVLPDGKSVVFTIWSGSLQTSELALTSMDDGVVHRLGIQAISPLGVAGDHLVYVRSDGTVHAIRFDASSGKVTGDPTPMITGVFVCPGCNGDAGIRLSRSGTLAYMTGASESHFVWMSPSRVTTRIAAPARSYLYPRLSPDGRRILVTVGGSSSDIWIFELANGTLSRVTGGTGGNNVSGIWTPDGKQIIYYSERDQGTVVMQPADGNGDPRPLLARRLAVPMSVSPDGRTLLFMSFENNSLDLETLDLTSAAHTVTPYLKTEAHEGAGAFSPDGRYVAYVSNETGTAEVYVRPYPNTGGRVQVSVNGGYSPVWGRDGNTLYYRTGTSYFVASVTTRPSFAIQSRRALFEGNFTSVGDYSPNFDVGTGSQPLLMLESERNEFGVVVVANWVEDLKRRLMKQ